MKPDPTPRPKRALVEDPELLAINRIVRALTALDEAARQRVLAWMTAKYLKQGKATDAT